MDAEHSEPPAVAGGQPLVLRLRDLCRTRSIARPGAGLSAQHRPARYRRRFRLKHVTRGRQMLESRSSLM